MESVKELPSTYLYLFGIIAYIAALSSFVYFFHSNYVETIQQAFVSLDPSSGDCRSVSIPVTGKYLADQEGNWIGTKQFSYFDASHRLGLTKFDVDDLRTYQDMITVFEGSFKELGKKTEKNNLAYNLLVWISFIDFHTIDHHVPQYMELSATPSAVFDKSFIYASSGNANSSCSVPGDSSFDSANSLLKVSYKYQDYRSSPECVTTLNPRSTGHYSNRMTNFKFDLDVRSFSTAMAVNLGIIPTFALRSTSTQPSPLIHNGVNYVLAQFVDIRHTTMDRMYCLRNMSEVGLGQGVER